MRSVSGQYVVPPGVCDIDDCIGYIQSLPRTDPPEVCYFEEGGMLL